MILNKAVMRYKIFILIFFFLRSMITYCQKIESEVRKIDSNGVDILTNSSLDVMNESIRLKDIVDKAKLLTLNKMGVIENEKLNKILLEQVSESYYFNTNLEYRFLIIKIKSSQKFLSLENGEYEDVGDLNYDNSCNYLIVYSYYSKQFYILEGKSEKDYKTLKKEFKANTSLIHYQLFMNAPIMRPFVKRGIFGKLKRRKNTIVCGCGSLRKLLVY